MTTDHGPRTIHEAAAALRAGTLTPVGLLDQCLARIDVYEPHVRAWVLLDRDGARAQAERLTAEARRGQWRGPLHGIPVGVKDIIDVFDLPTGCGSKLWADSYARRDASCVRKLRQAGAVILGKTVTTTFAFLDPPVTRNPWDRGRTPGGSSSGSAAAVACGMCLAALGSQTGGSLTRPAAYCGIACCKPAHGRIAPDGVLPLAPALDHLGAYARCARDLAILMDVLCPPGRRDSLAHDDRLRPIQQRLDAEAANVLGRFRGLFDERAEPAMRACLDRVCGRLVPSEGIPSRRLPAAFSEVLPRHRTIMAVGAATFHRQRLQRRPEDYPPRIRGLVEEGVATPAPEYADCQEHQRALRREMRRYFGDDLLACLTPAAPGPAPDPSTTGDAVMNAPWSYTGLPTVSIPAGRSEDGLPLGVQLVGGDTATLLGVAAWCEARLGYDMALPPVPG